MNQVIEQILNDVSKEYGDFYDLTEKVKIAMHRLAEHCCKEQKQLCVEGLEVRVDPLEGVDYDYTSASIDNAPLASDKYKP